jgi:hypothetical protein
MSEETTINAALTRLLSKSKARLRLEKWLISLSLVALYGALAHGVDSVFTNLYLFVALSVSLAVCLSVFAIWPFLKQRKKLNQNNLLQHLNRHFVTLEESARLLVANPASLSLLQRLQQQKVNRQLVVIDAMLMLDRSLPPLRYRLSLSITVLMVFSVLSVDLIGERSVLPADSGEAVKTTLQDQPQPLPQLQAGAVIVRPPAYTALPKNRFEQLDIEVIEGSTVQWQLRLSPPSSDYQIIVDGLPAINLKRQADGVFFASSQINKTAIYRIKQTRGDDLTGIYSIAVNKDKKPKVRIIEPDKSLLVLAKSAPAYFDAKALVSDDFGIGEVKILASVAKGSGEAVKFRDAEFSFDSKTHTNKNTELHSKRWDLKALGMAPGDEVYFTVVATDNKADAPQQGRSGTVIVRWLDDEEEGITAEGVVMNFIAEYFRSQRQIIIETEQLIADKADFSEAAFTGLSVELGQAQSDLKQRYGQYLGDEFGNGPGDQLSSHEEPAEHEHEDPGEHGRFTDNSGAAQVLDEFAHTHEAVWVGEAHSQNPKAMMKKAVSMMWEAELQLLMSAPDLALPFEKQAYKYLKLAKQAERIYVKRLGFVPPPVKESKRLTGELKDIHSYKQTLQASPNLKNDDELFRQTFTLLNRLAIDENLKPLAQALLKRLKTRLTDLAQTRPGLIKQAATVQSVLLANTINIKNCAACIKGLSDKLWQLISSPLSHPVAGQQNFINSDPLIGDYVQHLQEGEAL